MLESAKRTGRVVSAEEAQIVGGLGGVIAETLSEKMPTPLLRIGMNDRYGESGQPRELLEHFGMTGPKIAERVLEFVQKTPQYHREY